MPINERGEFIRESEAPKREVLPEDPSAKPEKITEAEETKRETEQLEDIEQESN